MSNTGGIRKPSAGGSGTPNPMHKLGWKPDKPDARDYVYGAPAQILQALPSNVDLRPFMPPIYDQGRIGSCTANAIAAAVQFDRRKAKQNPDFIPSRLFIYYNERAIEGDVQYDNGAQIRDGKKTVTKQGVCPETLWPYDDTPAGPNGAWPSSAKPAQQPAQPCYQEALKHEAKKAVYYRINNGALHQLKGCLAEGYPFVFGIKVYGSFWDANGQPQTTIPMPGPADWANQVGGHAIVGVGYDDGLQSFICRNSWGPNVQDNGNFYLPMAYVTGQDNTGQPLAQDFWTFRRMKS